MRYVLALFLLTSCTPDVTKPRNSVGVVWEVVATHQGSRRLAGLQGRRSHLRPFWKKSFRLRPVVTPPA